MSVLPYAVALNPDASGELLRAAAAHVRDDDHGARAALLAHPALPADVDLDGPGDPNVPTDELDSVSIDTALRLPHTTATSRARLLAHVALWALVQYADQNPDAHRDALTALTSRLRHEPGSRARMLAVLHHPAADPDIELDALKTHLTLLTTSPDQFTYPGDLEYALTRATAHPAHLRDLAAAVPPDHDLHTQLLRYADLNDTGHDPYTARLVDIRTRLLDTLRWADAITFTGDPGLAVEALDATERDTQESDDAVRAILGHPRLRATTAAYRAHLRFTGKTDTGPAPATPTDADLARAGHHGRERAPSRSRAHLCGELLDFTIDTLGAAHRATPPDGPGWAILRGACVLALHPDLTPSQRGILTAILAERMPAQPDSPARAIHTIASSMPDADATLRLPVAQLAAAAYDPRTSADLARLLMPVVATHTTDLRVARALLSLEVAFTGTLAELLATAHTISR